MKIGDTPDLGGEVVLALLFLCSDLDPMLINPDSKRNLILKYFRWTENYNSGGSNSECANSQRIWNLNVLMVRFLSVLHQNLSSVHFNPVWVSTGDGNRSTCPAGYLKSVFWLGIFSVSVSFVLSRDLQRGLESRTFTFRAHSKSKRLDAPIWDGLVLEWSGP